MKLFRSPSLQISGILLVAAAWKMLLVLWDVIPFNSDEAIVALMARHILNGERPIFFYGQAYMGSLDAYLVALGFLIFGEQVWVIRLVQGGLYLGTILTTYAIGCVAFDSQKIGLVAAGLMAIPTVNMTLYTTASLGGYGEALLIGNLTLLLAFLVGRRWLPAGNKTAAGLGIFGWGILVGCGLWANGLTLVYSLPAGVYLAWKVWQQAQSRGLGWLLYAIPGVLLGSLPWWIFALDNGLQLLLLELFGTAVSVESDSWLLRTAKHLVYFVLLGTSVIFGFRPPWNTDWLALPLLPFVLFFWLMVAVLLAKRIAKQAEHRAEYAVLLGVIGALLAGFLFTPFGVDPSGRYFLPVAVPLALAAADLVTQRFRSVWQAAVLISLVIGYQFWGTLQCALKDPGLTTQFHEPTVINHRVDGDLIEFLRQAGVKRGYSNYWVAYPLAFLSGEELIFSPRLPYHLDLRYTSRDDRYPAYTAQVEESEQVAYITTRNPALDDHLQAQFIALGITFKDTYIGDYHVYYQLSSAIRPEQIGLGEDR